MSLVEAIGMVMLVFGVGLYELFISNLGLSKSRSDEIFSNRSNFFGLFTLKSKKAVIPVDLLYFTASVLLSFSCLYLLLKLNDLD